MSKSCDTCGKVHGFYEVQEEIMEVSTYVERIVRTYRIEASSEETALFMLEDDLPYHDANKKLPYHESARVVEDETHDDSFRSIRSIAFCEETCAASFI